MRLALPLISLFSPLALAALSLRVDALRPKAPPAPRRPPGDGLQMRVHVALQAAARARR